MRARISQAQARRWKADLDLLRYQVERGGIHIDTVNVTNTEACIVSTAARLRHVVIARQVNDSLQLFAVKP